jgi:uncharacterized membrane protein
MLSDLHVLPCVVRNVLVHIIELKCFGAFVVGDAEFQVPADEEDVDAALCNNKKFRDVQSAHSAVSEMLNEDCSHLLRKAQTALGKAGSGGAGSGGGGGGK